MRLLLDEMYPAAIADQLRRRSHDVQAVTDRPELRTLSDLDLFDAAQRDRRAVVTENIADFSIIADRFDERRRAHYGLVFADPTNYQRGKQRTVGLLVKALDQFLRRHPKERASSLRAWL